MPNKQGNTAGNISNKGLVAIQDDWLYVLAAIKQKTNGDDFTAINGGGTPQGIYLNAVGDWLYYRSFENGCIYKVHINGGTPLQLNSHSSTNILVVDEWIYYTKQDDKNAVGGKICRMKTDGSLSSTITNCDCGDINVIDDWVYYINYDEGERSASGCIYKIKVNGRGMEKLSDESACNVNVVGDWIYFGNASRGHTFWKMKTDGSEKQMLLDGVQGSSWNVSGDSVYYRKSSRKALCKARLDGSDFMDLDSGDMPTDILVAGDWVYYGVQSGGVYKIRTNGTDKGTM